VRLAIASAAVMGNVAACRDDTGGSGPMPPVGDRILFTTARNGKPDIYIMHADGTEVRVITADAATDQSADLTHHDIFVAFMSTRVGGVYQVFRIPTTTRATMQLTSGTSDNGFPRWSPDDQQIVFTSLRDGNMELYRMRANGLDQVRLTVNGATDTGADWSPDGRRLAFLSNRDGKTDIYLMNVDGTGTVRLTTDDTEKAGRASWSPDGTQIAFHAFEGNTADLFIINADGTGLRRLTTHPANDRYPVWSPQGDRIAFASDRDGNDEIYVMNVDGTGLRRLTTSSGLDVPDAWR